jgi:hypothetical protein
LRLFFVAPAWPRNATWINRVWEWPSKLLRRRVDDQAIDYVKVLGGEDLSLSKEEQPAKKHWWRFWARKTPVDRSKELAA